MAINSDIRDHAYQFFIEEAPELLQIIETGLLTLQQEKTISKVHELMRSAHSLKGGSASVGLETIEALAHRLETIFKALYSDIEIDTDLESQLLQAYDCLRLPLIEQITTGSFNTEQALAAAEPIFAQIEERLGDALAQDDIYLPSSTELGINMAISIFEVDVGQGLQHLARVAAHPANFEVAGELRAQAEVFCGFAELLNQPEFGTIAASAIAALDACPECALEILQLAIADFELCRQAILAEESPLKIIPSAALVAFANTTQINTIDFPAILDLEAAIYPDLESAENIEAAPSLEAIFGDFAHLDSPETIEAAPSLEAIFGDFTELDSPETIEAAPSLEAIFGDFAHLESAENIEAAPSLEAIFGDFVAPAEEEVFQNPLTDAPETLEIAIQSIEQIFDSLPATSELTSSSAPDLLGDGNQEPALPTKKSRLGSLAQNNETIASNLTIRVDSQRLERMSNLVGELAINRNGLSLQNEQMQVSVRELQNRYLKVQNLVSQLRELSDKMLVGTSNRFLSTVTPMAQSRKAGLHHSQFDSLELDSYSVLNSQFQEFLEEMMQLEEAVDDIKLFAKATDTTLEKQRQNMTQLRDELMWARMLPLSEVLNRFPRILRDLSTTYQKPVQLRLSGTSVLVDKAILEKLYDPLLHLLRNAFDHGIEAPAIRRQLFKPEQGQIEIRAYHRGSQTIVEVQDDGQGLNFERIRQRVLELDWLSAAQLVDISDARLAELIFEPGFSTASQVSELSGRGVGLDVVRLQLRSLKGTVTVASSPKTGTTFTLKLPLTLTIANLLICIVGVTALAFPADSIEEIVIPKTAQIQYSGTQRFLCWQEQIVPTYRLADLLNYACPLPQNPDSKAYGSVPTPASWAKPMLVMRVGIQVFALEVERLVTEQELVIKSFGESIAPPDFSYGCTVLGDGSLVPVVDAAVLLETVVNQNFTQGNIAINHASPDLRLSKTPTILVVDDAVALRRTLALTLEKSGFRVLQAPDGREAIKQLQQSSVDLVVCDIEMPNMNGFEFLSVRRQEPQSDIPIIMLTSRSNEKHRRLAMQLGASAYFTKPYIEQDFVKAIRDILSQSAKVISY
jgi:chemotaxis family two-component system sensor histidine kinase/response regulator PixL